MDQQQQSRWQPTRRQVLWVVIITALLFLITVICGYLFTWHWTGLPKAKVPQNMQPTKSLWDWLELLIVPIVLVLGGYLFTRSENRRTLNIADQQRALDRQIADERRLDDTLQAYLDSMSQLLTDKVRPLRKAGPDDSLRTVARAKTLSTLTRLNPTGSHLPPPSHRKRTLLQFLYESDLITKNHAVLDLKGADLSDAALERANLEGVDLSGANLVSAYLMGADLSGANLEGVTVVYADMSYALMRGANLSFVGLRDADLTQANLSNADLSNADITNEELEQQAFDLEGATMPNGQKYEEWIKSRGEGEKGGSS